MWSIISWVLWSTEEQFDELTPWWRVKGKSYHVRTTNGEWSARRLALPAYPASETIRTNVSVTFTLNELVRRVAEHWARHFSSAVPWYLRERRRCTQLPTLTPPAGIFCYGRFSSRRDFRINVRRTVGNLRRTIHRAMYVHKVTNPLRNGHQYDRLHACTINRSPSALHRQKDRVDNRLFVVADPGKETWNILRTVPPLLDKRSPYSNKVQGQREREKDSSEIDGL